jgi:two-component system chemotaxis family response regulator WspR
MEITMENNSIPEITIDTTLPAHPIMVVLVDDQPMVAETLRRMLEGEGDIDFHYCIEAEDAVNLVAKIHPTLILQDLIMPHVDGLELVRQYRAHAECRDIPIIVLSSREDPKIKAEAFALGANDYVVKLPDKLELVARIRYHSQWYIHKQQRDDAYRSLQESQRQLKDMNLKLLRLSTHDGLTNIPNRYYFDQVFSDEWSRTNRDKTPLSLIMIDIDYFKNYNDGLGHQAGDQCLVTVACMLSKVLHRPADTVARYGGEEFVVLLPGTDAKGAQTIAETMRSEVAALKVPHPGPSTSDFVTISLGVATAMLDNLKRSEELLHAADKALYYAKQDGRNRVKVAAQ